MFAWIGGHPHEAVAVAAVLCGGVAFLVRFVLSRHREYIVFTAHMAREESEIWPAITKQLADYHAETLAVLSGHGERITRLEAKMPNGQLADIHRILTHLEKRGR